MLPEERRILIRERLASQRTVSAVDLARELRVAIATIRRDLATLDSAEGDEEKDYRKIRRMLSRSSRLRDILSKPMSDHETEAV